MHPAGRAHPHPQSLRVPGSYTTSAPWRSWTAALREELRTQTLRLTGNRIHPMATRIGGLAVDADDWLQAEREVADAGGTGAAEAVLTKIDSPRSPP